MKRALHKLPITMLPQWQRSVEKILAKATISQSYEILQY